PARRNNGRADRSNFCGRSGPQVDAIASIASPRVIDCGLRPEERDVEIEFARHLRVAAASRAVASNLLS
ncbi:MAG TPA: hypothetical protein VK629_12765, partial [Steroidobacteraceae bacterium]|nr:hypothetical protein [Steroidobacteraceae bacterium]